MKTVELKTAYHWHCEECSADNYDRGIVAEFGPGEREEAFRDFHELDEFSELPEGWEQFEMVAIPEVVKCRECGAEFQAIHEHE